MTWFRKKPERSDRVDPEEITAKAEEAIAQLQSQQPHVTYITGWLERRRMRNGFGDDFEFTLTPKESQ